jgi:hypothetical protein
MCVEDVIPLQSLALLIDVDQLTAMDKFCSGGGMVDDLVVFVDAPGSIRSWLFRYVISASRHADFSMIPGFAPKVAPS